MTTRYVAGISIPDSAMARAAAELMRATQSDLMFDAARRTFVFASLIGQGRELGFEPDLLYVSALFLRIGITTLYRHSQQRFEVDSANAAAQFLHGYGRSRDDIAQVWDAIALHTTPGIPQHKPALTALLAAAVETDLLGTHGPALCPGVLASVLSAFPREPGFKIKFLHALAEGQLHRRPSTVGTVNADVLSFHDHRLLAGGFCERLLASTWPY
ncbi:phosphohydrolase [Pseudomonas sp. UBA1879]|uniref:phosphohydrolase n=1 Tax=Pseudomonas sp. UBA1879 TaxID=1947305 RepID=UPI0025DB6639|nr:phosphohydrolase [Pseudomonas sp. UBA1879]